MKTVLLGKSSYFDSVVSLLEKEGLDVSVAETPAEARGLVNKYPVVLISQSEITPFLTDKEYAWRLIQAVDPLDPIVLLLDKESDSNPYLWKLVLQRAIEIAKGKRHVFVLSRSVGSRMYGLELLYSQARELGVSFIKYEKLYIEENEDIALITIDDGSSTYSISTPLFVECTYSADRNALEYSEALRLRTHDDGKINSDRWYLLRGRTSRKNVYYIDTGLLISMPLENIVRYIANEIKGPISTNDSIAQIEAKKCAFCYTCFRVCPHGALAPDNAAHAMGVIDSNCTGCGICISVCPANAIEIKKPESTAVSTEEERSTRGHLGEGPYSLAFCCENSAAIAAKSLADEELSNVSLVSVPCGGYLDAAQIIQALNKFERVIIAVCPDDACKHYDGNKRAKLQVEKVKKLLETFSIDPNRVDFVQLSHVMPYPLRDALSK